MLENMRCVVLNASYEPLSVVSAKRGLRMILNGRAVLENAAGNVCTNSLVNGKAIIKKFPLPTQVRLREMIKSIPAMHVRAQLTQRNLFCRDKWTCQYCGRPRRQLGTGEYLTRDHIIPETRGGKDTWKNVVTSCRKCNNIKSDNLLSEMEDQFFRYSGMAETSMLGDEARESARETAEWVSDYLIDVHLNPRAPMILELWSKSGNLKLRKKKK